MAYATLDELKGRLDWTLDADEERIATGALEDASDLAAYYGNNWADAASAPRLVRTLVLKAAARYMRNPGGYTQSRAGDETLGWNDSAGENAGTVYFTDEEQRLLSSLAGRNPGIFSVPISAWNSKISHGTGYVPDAGGQADIPFFAEGYE
ncbi:head-tail adaptor Ad1 [Streptomyces phage Hydra]|uniref:Head-to-tail adaptor n=3 Tax=Likavirus TaxID=1982880 RepID=A0A291AWM1_9CAUD|nr:head-tail adaptor Ad1 [Streptomyces phage Hydra]ATE84890.1 head-to-tail adaptor [Streptomyces phage BeardedLady]ATE85416.1 head-to-tail adaptor [Streptomyces phage Ozzie]UJQ86429.1 head-to-tail adaptor [Streptomyces phage SunsetPointe]UJQ86631.1 head-to-tail adaptor [Streptomyces phage Unstoppable]URQ04926.1 head-to-tail adaptor [Streptomyces phage Legacy]